MAQVVLDRLTKVFTGAEGGRFPAVNDLSLTVEDGELLVVVGPSGSGKTTTLRLIAGLEEPTDGTISIGGRRMNGLAPKDRDVAMVFQNQALYPHLSARENIAFGLRLRGFPRAEIERRMKQAEEILGLNGCLDRKPAELSGGERQRVALGRAIVRQPDVFLFDEPLSQLDSPLRAQLRAEFVRLRRRLQATMIYVTHDQLEAITLGDRIAVLNGGVLQQVAAPIQVYQRPANLFVAGFMGSPPMNFLPGALVTEGTGLGFRVEGPPDFASAALAHSLSIPEDTASALRPYLGKSLVLGIRPEHIVCDLPDVEPGGLPATAQGVPTFILGSGNGQEKASVRTQEAEVELAEPRGAETFLHLAWAGRPLIARTGGWVSLQPRQIVPFVLDMRFACFFDPGTQKAVG